MPSDMIWTPRSMGFEYVMNTRGNEEYISKLIESNEFWSTITIPKLYGNLRKNGNRSRNGYRR
jgi:hypothetical protein